MANQSAERFIKQVVAASCRKFKPDPYTVEMYKQKLSKWYLTDDEWSRAMSKFIADYLEEGLPPLPMLYGILRDCRLDRTPSGCAMIAFSMNGLRYVMAEPDPNCKPDVRNKLRPKRIDPSFPPTVPEGAEDVHLIIPPELQDKSKDQYYGSQVDDFVASVMP